MKKKLDEMTEEEIKKLEKRYCTVQQCCYNCPLNVTNELACLSNFYYWKNIYKTYKDKEFEIEVKE